MSSKLTDMAAANPKNFPDIDPEGPLPKELTKRPKKGEEEEYSEEDRDEYRARRRSLAAYVGHQTRTRNNLLKAVDKWETDKNASASAEIKKYLKQLDEKETKIEDSLNEIYDRGFPTKEWEDAVEKAAVFNVEARDKAAKALEEYDLDKATRTNDGKDKSVDNGLKPWTLKYDATAVEYHNWLTRFEGFIDKNKITSMPTTTQYSYILSNVDRQLQELLERTGNKTMKLMIQVQVLVRMQDPYESEYDMVML